MQSKCARELLKIAYSKKVFPLFILLVRFFNELVGFINVSVQYLNKN
uniref:Uncharacterized protein n=1 Tax=Anguilla anguilla TaxID=7936 RepID=A0A0E9P5Q6_ANGAN